MQPLKLALLFLAAILQLVSSYPFPVDMTPQIFHGTIEGSPVIAVLHGSSDVQKDDVRDKDSEDDPLDKFGPAFGDHPN